MRTYLLPIGPVALMTAPTLETPMSQWQKIGYSLGDAAIRPAFTKAHRRNDHAGSTPVAGGTFVTGHDAQVEMRISAETLQALAAAVQGLRVKGGAVGLVGGLSRLEERAWALVPVAEISESGDWIRSESATILPAAIAEVSDVPSRGVPESDNNQEGYALRLTSVTGGSAPLIIGHAWAHGLGAFGLRSVFDFSLRSLVAHPPRAFSNPAISRATSAWYRDAVTGAWTLAAENVPRFVKASDGRVGLLLENQSTNLVLRNHTQAALAAGVSLAGPGAAGATLSVVWDGLSYFVPEGLQGFMHEVGESMVAECDNSSGTSTAYLAFAGGGAATECIVSAFVRRVSGSGPVSVGWARPGTPRMLPDSINYHRIWQHHTNPSPAPGTVYVEVPPGHVVRAVLAQCEPVAGGGHTPSSIIPTSGAVATRAGDFVTLPFRELIDDTITVGVDIEQAGEHASIPVSTGAMSGTKHFHLENAGNRVRLRAGRDLAPVSELASPVMTHQASRRIVAQISPAAWRLFVNGSQVAVAAPPPQSLPTSALSGNTLRFPLPGGAYGGFILKGFFIAEGILSAEDADIVLGNLLTV